MSGLNPFRHKKTASTAVSGAVAAPDPASSSSSQTAASDSSASLLTAQPGNRPRGGQDKRQTGQDDEGRRPGPAEEWLSGLEVDVARQKQGQTQQHYYSLSRPLFENTKQIPSPGNNDDIDSEEGYFGSTVSEYTSAGSVGRQLSGHRPSTPGVQPAEDPFNAAIGSSGSSDEDDDDEDDEIERLNAREKDGLGLGLGPVADMPSLRRVSYQGDLRSKGQEQEQEQEHAEAGATKKRATMDVDAFKRLLLTGDAAGKTNESRDLSAAATAAQENQTKPAGDKKLQKPPPPKSRRGKAISSSSRSSESTEKSTEATGPVSPQATSHTKSPASSIHGAQPPSPPARRQAAQSEPAPAAHTQHKRPPTPPITRRYSQMKRSSANTSRLALPPGSTKPLNRSASLNSATHPKTPPPPPSRRAGTDHGSTASSIHDTSSIDTPIQHQKADSETSPQHNPHLQAPSHTHTHTHPPTTSTARPQPPPPRRTAGSTHSSHSTETNHPSSTSTSARRPSSISTETEDHPIPPPPPPPPPHRKNSRGSNPPEPDISPPSNANDILANLSQLQHDLDEFRGQYGDRDRDRSSKK
ncbi:hypothetical protein H109_06910 [Trichophyton interdigitale MR816]|uniref:Uncharacterized protein n=1 Tax=Trichophyton interdigitale (strain MR816) TaxID=1215338 RepID=A0A059J0D8_TRIIM|nr:hypothetical protein H109_06910 [Trichophyton interdigitale MR816]